MVFKIVNEEETAKFSKSLLVYYDQIDNGSIKHIYTSKDEEAMRNNVGWYQHIGSEHHLSINAYNITAAKYYIDLGLIDYDTFYAFVTLVVGHEFRHFLQARCIYDGEEIDGYGQKDVLAADLMLYIRFFFDVYYLYNKGSVKYELDAEKFSVINGIKFLKERYPKLDAENLMVKAVNFFAGIQVNNGVVPTLPLGCESANEIVSSITAKIDENSRYPNLEESLQVHHPRFLNNHERFGLDYKKLFTQELARQYFEEQDGVKRDLLVAKRILSSLEHPLESLEEFPNLKKLYVEKRL